MLIGAGPRHQPISRWVVSLSKTPARMEFLQVLVSSDMCRQEAFNYFLSWRKFNDLFDNSIKVLLRCCEVKQWCVKAVIWSETFLSSHYQAKAKEYQTELFWQSQKLVSQSTINNFFGVAWENFCKNAKFWRYNFQFQGINFFFRKINSDKKERNEEKLLTPNIVTSSDQKFGKFHNGFRQVKCPEIKVKQKK